MISSAGERRGEPRLDLLHEAHGTGTEITIRRGSCADDSVRRSTKRRGFCAIGSLKNNVGHLDAASGIAGVIKTVLALEHHQLPPTIHFDRPNPEIDFAATPFFVNASLRDWTTDGGPRRAGVHAFGIGGTNAHVIVEEAPAARPSSPRGIAAHRHLRAQRRRSTRRPPRSSRSRGALGHPDALADAAYT